MICAKNGLDYVAPSFEQSILILHGVMKGIRLRGAAIYLLNICQPGGSRQIAIMEIRKTCSQYISNMSRSMVQAWSNTLVYHLGTDFMGQAMTFG